MKTDLSLLKGELAGCEASQWRVLGRHRRGRVCRLALVPQLGRLLGVRLPAVAGSLP